ncbi:MAG: hypothetical protein Kow0029_22960 [Candidatus Rifleibacteriota bacterium]
MSQFALLYNSSFEDEMQLCEVAKIPEVLKKYPEGLYRSSYFLETEDFVQFKKFVSGSKDKHFGPLNLTFSVRRARDLLTEGCEYQGLSLEIESGGRRLPQLPGASELKKILDGEDCLIYVNGSAYKPSTEVFGFQQVYDDSVKCIDALKRLGIPQETMTIFATPEEISIEVHAGVLGLEGRDDLNSLYLRLICAIADVKNIDGKLVKNIIRTIVLQTCKNDYTVLLPGSTHPTLHRPKVGVGTSHFAYGIAAFSDYCSKKRSIEECVQESLNWLKFVQTQLPPIPGLKEKIEALPEMPFPEDAGKNLTAGVTSAKTFSGRFQPLSVELAGAAECYQEPIPAVKSLSNGLDKILGGGWNKFGVHMIAGPVGSGKASFLMQQAKQWAGENSVLYVSYEHGLREFALRSALSGLQVNLNDLLALLPQADAQGVEARKMMAEAIEKYRTSLSESFYFSGVENCRNELDVEEIHELARLLPEKGEKIVILESLNENFLGESPGERFNALRRIAYSERLTLLLSMHIGMECGKRPHFIEGIDNCLLEKFQRYTDSIVVTYSEKLNLRRFVAMVKGQIDPQLVGKLEQRALQLAGGKRLKSDTYSFFRVIHTRNGRRELVLYLFQPDFVRFHEVASMPLSKA